MGAALLITLREGLEISLVLAVIVGYLVKTGRAEYLRPVWIGSGLAALVSVIGGFGFKAIIGEFQGRWEQAIEGTLAVFTVVVLTWMVFWMRKNARNLSGELHGKVDAALTHSPLSLGIMAFIAVAREGFEAALFLIGAETGTTSGSRVVLGGVIGLGIAAVLGVSFYRGSDRINLRQFFQLTGILLILFAAGLFAKAVHEFRLLFEIEWGFIADTVWNVTSGPLAEGSTTHDFLKGLFGWSPNPERIRVVAYWAYLAPITWLFLGRRPQPKKDEAPSVRPKASV